MFEQQPGAEAAWNDDDLRRRHLLQRSVGHERQSVGLVAHRALLFGDEQRGGAGHVLEHLVGTDNVDGGEAVVEQKRNLHVVLFRTRVANATSVGAIALGRNDRLRAISAIRSVEDVEWLERLPASKETRMCSDERG